MIISKTPYRIPLTGGGTDLDFYYKKRSGSLFSLAINQYVYVHLHHRKVDKNYLVQTTKSEFTSKIDNISHFLIRETLKYFKLKEKLHVATYTTVPTNTGLGSSSAMVIGLINCITKFKNIKISNKKIIKTAYKIERKICKQYGGWQDQTISQMGGLIQMNISKDEKLQIKKKSVNNEIDKKIKNNFLLVYTKKKRISSKVVLSQKKRKSKILDYYDNIKSLNKKLLFSMRSNNPKYIADIFNKHWENKKKLSSKMTSNVIDNLYFRLMKNYNFLGGKLIGAGGGGFFLMVTPDKKKTISLLNRDKIAFIDFRIEKFGAKIIEG
ncbi:MAG: hypothetical protein CMN79_00900 [Spirochaetales bacterium]|jgi:D-glycero-alpha-D-manno-heptose-7-phosphate kinase|nr:hypothetical protein [Spirochaetales bacterium]|tara:strand:+ start:333 stop:1304 length:972 start_codon:yes stop_codon:yes gene_type:complete